MANYTQVESRICEAVDCNNNATEKIQINLEKNSPLIFQVCSNCKPKFFKNGEFSGNEQIC